MDKPNLVEIDFRVDGNISKKHQEVMDKLDKDIEKLLLKYGYLNIYLKWEN